MNTTSSHPKMSSLSAVSSLYPSRSSARPSQPEDVEDCSTQPVKQQLRPSSAATLPTDYDNVVTHRLWRLSDGSNTGNSHNDCATRRIAARPFADASDAEAARQCAVPLSRDALTRMYQVGAMRPLHNNAAANATSCASLRSGTYASVSPPLAASPLSFQSSTVRPSSSSAAVNRISESAKHIAMLAASLGCVPPSLKNTSLVRLAEEEARKQQQLQLEQQRLQDHPEVSSRYSSRNASPMQRSLNLDESLNGRRGENLTNMMSRMSSIHLRGGGVATPLIDSLQCSQRGHHTPLSPLDQTFAPATLLGSDGGGPTLPTLLPSDASGAPSRVYVPPSQPQPHHHHNVLVRNSSLLQVSPGEWLKEDDKPKRQARGPALRPPLPMPSTVAAAAENPFSDVTTTTNRPTFADDDGDEALIRGMTDRGEIFSADGMKDFEDLVGHRVGILQDEDLSVDMWAFEYNKLRTFIRSYLILNEDPMQASLASSRRVSLDSPLPMRGQTSPMARRRCSVVSLADKLKSKLSQLEDAEGPALPAIKLTAFDVDSEDFQDRLSFVEQWSECGGDIDLPRDAYRYYRTLFDVNPRRRSSLARGSLLLPAGALSPNGRYTPPPVSLERRLNAKSLEDEAAAKLHRTRSIVEYFGPCGTKMVPEQDTNIPPNELHLYQLYCVNMNMIIIFRPVSPSVPPMYAGNFFVPPAYCDSDGIPLTIDEINPNLTLKEVLSFTTAECRVKGKGIGVSLKSSPYPPIDGFIPINPSLSKTYSEARKKERALEDHLMSSGGDVVSTALLKKIRSQRSLFGAATSVAMKEIEASLKDSDTRLEKLLEKYKVESSYAVDKLAVAQEYIGVLNETQFLGKTTASWRGYDLYYKQAPDDTDVERRVNANPVFYCLSKRQNTLVQYDQERNELANDPELIVHLTAGWEELYHPVYILTHRSFVISNISKRIEPDPQGDFLIGPDFDGFAYGSQVPLDETAEGYVMYCENLMNLRVLPTMGLVNDLDIAHLLEIRMLTEWKQSHGYECSNTLKTQDITDGNHVIILPTNEIRIATNFPELIDFYREAWLCGYPLLLNPNWKVTLSPHDCLPVLCGDEYPLPIVDDCGLAMVKHQLSSIHKKFEEVKDEAYRYLEELTSLRRRGMPRIRVNGTYTTSLIPRVALVLAKKHLADTFYKLRRWMLMPPFMNPKLVNRLGDSPSTGKGIPLRKGDRSQAPPWRPATAMLNHDFEFYRNHKVSELRREFDDECSIFEAVFASSIDNDAMRFTKRLRFFCDQQNAAAAAAAFDQMKAEIAGGAANRNSTISSFLEPAEPVSPRDKEAVTGGAFQSSPESSAAFSQ